MKQGTSKVLSISRPSILKSAPNPNSTFGDLLYRYSLKKKKIDFELSAYNLFNEKYFSQNNFSANYEQRFVYKLRPTQFMLTTRFNF